MKLWSKQLEAKARKYPLYSQDGKGMNAKILVKYFNPYGAGTWLITEAEKQDNGVCCSSATLQRGMSGNGSILPSPKSYRRK